MSPTASDILLYQSPDGQIQLDVQLDHDTMWLTQAQMSELFSREIIVISKHLRNIFQTGELDGRQKQCAKNAHCFCRPSNYTL